jgi:hypothetical protein
VLLLLGIVVLTLWWRFSDQSADADLRARSNAITAHGSTPSGASPTLGHHFRNVYAGIERGKFSSAVAGFPERVYVPNGEPGTVEEINPRTFRVIRTCT